MSFQSSPASGPRARRFADLSLATKLYAALAGLLLLMALAVLTVTQTSLRRNTRRLLDARQVRELALTSRTLLLTQDDITKAMLLAPEKMDLAAGKLEAYEESREVFQRMDSLAASPEVSNLIAALRRLDEERLRPLDTQILERMAEGNLNAAKRLYFAEYDSLRTAYYSLVADLATVAERAAATAARRLEVDNRRAIALSLLLGIGLVSAGVFVFGRRVGRRLGAAVGLLEAVAAGDLTRAVAVDAGDEIGRMAGALNRTVDALRRMIADIQATSRQLLARSEEIAAAAAESENVVRGLDGAIQQVADGAQEQARSSEQTAAVMAELAGAIDEMVAQVQGMATAGNARVEVARSSADAVRQAIFSIEEVHQPVLDTAAQVHELGARSAEIGKISGTIYAVAAQTNMLSLNAAIEAARAGNHGRGFAVVADEVRKLARTVAQASTEIAELTRVMQQGTQKTIAAVNIGTARVAQSAEHARSAEPGLGEILQGLEATNHQLQEVARSAGEMLERVTRVSSLLGNVAAVSEESAAASEEMSAQSREVSQSMEQIAAMATERPAGEAGKEGVAGESLLAIAKRLRELVAGFQA
ncbi:MAG: methyl-accepting chemotaxis protein [Gemmatimonadetes bacterium]|nr:methyl-accepting chemotaxis protein [Gemmatimonadota bacterium]